MSLAHVRGFTHEQLRDRFKPLEAETIRYPNPNDPIGYTTLVVRWPVGVVLWQEICNRCSAVVESRAGHDLHHKGRMTWTANRGKWRSSFRSSSASPSACALLAGWSTRKEIDMPSCPHCQGELKTQEPLPERQVCGSCGRVAPSVPRAELLNDLAHLREILDDIEAEPEAWEALARIVGALKLTDEEETWLEEQ